MSAEQNYLLSLGIGFGGAVLGAWLGYYFTRRADRLRIEREEVAKRRSVIASILTELDLMVETLKDEPRPLRTEESLKLRTTPLPEAAYNSALSSGNFSLLAPALQKEITEFYSYVNVTNRTLEMFLEYAFYAEREQERFFKQIKAFVDDVNDRHDKINEKIQTLKAALNKAL